MNSEKFQKIFQRILNHPSQLNRHESCNTRKESLYPVCGFTVLLRYKERPQLSLGKEDFSTCRNPTAGVRGLDLYSLH